MKIKMLDRDVMEREIGYRPFTTFFEDFSIADAFGIAAIEETFTRCFESWQYDYKYMTELVLVLRWKVEEHFGDKKTYAVKYQELGDKADEWVREHLEGDELEYYYRTID
jgi:hypothetical protein